VYSKMSESQDASRYLIRNAVPTDIGVLRDVYRRSSLANEGDRMNLLANPDALELSDVAVNQGRTRVAIADGRIVGFSASFVARGIIELEDLFVEPEWTRRGVGRQLVLDLVAIARKRRIRRVEVTANKHALVFYRKAGFVFDGDIDTRFGAAHRMHRDVELV